jgi:dihydroorotate dehydrogenase (fumarate)
MGVDLRTRYLGLDLAGPIVPSASPMSYRLDSLMRLEDAGASAVVLQSLFEEQIETEEMDLHRLLEQFADSYAEAATYFPELDTYNMGPESYLEFIETAKRMLRIPVIASLNGVSLGGWTRYAKLMEDAGADAIELNIYFVAADPDETGDEVEERYLDLVAAVRERTSVPLAVKIGPFFSSVPHMAKRLVAAGADGLVLFNRFLQPDIDLDTLEVVPGLKLSTADELRLPLRWIAILKDRVPCSLAATTGIHAPEDAVKVVLAGADVAMMASALLRDGPERLGVVLRGVEAWLEEHEYVSLEQAKGSLSQASSPNPAAFERSNYMRAITTFAGPETVWRAGA